MYYYYSYSINDCILVIYYEKIVIYYEKNTYDFMHAINSITIIMPTKTATYNSMIN